MAQETEERFEAAFKFMIAHEGGYINDSKDRGGATKFGISKRSYPKINIKSLTIDDAKAIYKRDFWDNQRYKDINDITLSIKIFDLSVNMGPINAHKLIQKALNCEGGNILEDGVLGSRTITTVNNSDISSLIKALIKEAENYYTNLVKEDPNQKKFLNGWITRARSMPDQ